jgi:hypothetical protein
MTQARLFAVIGLVTARAVGHKRKFARKAE